MNFLVTEKTHFDAIQSSHDISKKKQQVFDVNTFHLNFELSD